MSIYQINPQEVTRFLILGKGVPADYYYSRFNEYKQQLMNTNTSEYVLLLEAYAKGKVHFHNELKLLYDLNKNKLFPNKKFRSIWKEKMLKTILDKSKSNNTEIQICAALTALSEKYNELIHHSQNLDYFHSESYEGRIKSFADICFDIDMFFLTDSWRRTQMLPGLELFPLARNLMNYDIMHYPSVAPTGIFLIRQSIEAHILQSFGIFKIEYKRDDSFSPIPFSNVLGCLKKLFKDKKICLGVDLYIVDSIYRWTNDYIHTGQFNCPYWYLALIIDYLNNFFLESNELHSLYNKTELSVVKSIYIENFFNDKLYENLQNEIEGRIKVDVIITKLNKPNLVVVSQSELDKIQSFVKNKRTSVDLSKI